MWRYKQVIHGIRTKRRKITKTMREKKKGEWKTRNDAGLETPEEFEAEESEAEASLRMEETPRKTKTNIKR